MKNRRLWIFVAVAVLGAAALLLVRRKMAANKPKPQIAIQDGKTIDFSSGKPVVRDTAKEKASIEKAVKEMEDAAKGVSFPPPAAKPPEPKK